MRTLGFFQKAFLLGLLLVTISLACRKLDVTSRSASITAEEKFFTTNRSNDKVEAALVAFLKRTEAKQAFVKATAKKNRVPHLE